MAPSPTPSSLPMSSSPMPPSPQPPQSPPAAVRRPGDLPGSSSSTGQPLPRGQCRYILTLPELKGHRCACVSFSRDRALPGATCDCGHPSCFHLDTADASAPSPGRNRDDVDAVKRRIQALEHQAGLDGDRQGPLSRVVSRLSQLEEAMDRDRYELQSEVKGSYRHISASWQLIDQLQRRMAAFEETHRIQSEQLARAGKELQDLRNRNLELLETDEMLEERIEKLEGGVDAAYSSERELASRKGTDDDDEDDYDHSVHISAEPNSLTTPSQKEKAPSTPLSACLSPDTAGATQTELNAPSQMLSMPSTTYPSPGMTPTVTAVQAWTVHVSLLPSKERPLPYEKDTNAYKRCLSRGLLRMVAVEGTSGEAFSAAVSRAFRHVLGDGDAEGCGWEPLRAKICDARKLEGQTMLRPLESQVGDDGYSLDFLRRNCAVCDADGRLQALYIAPRDRVLSWNSIRRLPVYVEGLDSSWTHDQYLDDDDDGTEGDEADRAERQKREAPAAWPVALPSRLSTLKKRTAGEMQAASLATGGVLMLESEEASASKSRKCMPDMIEIQ